MNTQTIDLDVVTGGVPRVLKVSQFDTGARTLKFNLFASNNSLTLSGVRAMIEGMKPDGNAFSYDCTVSGSEVTANCTEQMTAVAGIVECAITITDSTGRLQTARFNLDVKPAPIKDDSLISDTEIPAIIELAREQEENARQYAESAEENAGIAEQSATTASEAATTATTKASEAAESADSAEDNAVLAESYAKGGTGTRTGEETDNGKYYATQARLDAVEAKNQADRAEQYADFVTPHFILQDNRLYIKDDAVTEFIVVDNRLYMKVA